MKRIEKNEAYLRSEIRCDIENRGLTQEQWAQEKGFSPSFICDVLAGRRNMTKKLVEAMGYERVVIYRRRDISRRSEP